MSKSKYKYKNGEAIRVREDLQSGVVYYMRSGPEPDTNGVETSWSGLGQVGHRGQIVHISHKANGRYKILEDGKRYYYTDEMFDRPKNLICKSLL